MVVFDLRSSKDSADDEKDKYVVFLQAEDIVGISDIAVVKATLKLECSSEDILKIFPRKKVFTLRLEPSWQKQLPTHFPEMVVYPEPEKKPTEVPQITEATASVPEGVEEEPQPSFEEKEEA
jgi:hypothetical protein